MIKVVPIDQFLLLAAQLPVIDARSESEFAQGHFPGSLNIPVLNNEQRIVVGTLYKQSGKEAAIMKGFQLVGPQFYDIFKTIRKAAPNKKLVVYCWRGGMRSNILAWMMNLADYEVYLLSGGYKAYRNYVHQLFEKPYRFTVLAGKTGVGKTDVLKNLASRGEQVLDLERLANHKGSAFGHIAQPPQPSVEHFENLMGDELRKFDINKPVWVEDESRHIGKVRIADTLFNQIWQSTAICIELPIEARIERIWKEYGVMPLDELIKATQNLERKLGGDRMRIACTALEAGDYKQWLEILLHYYDKTYAHSIDKRMGEKIIYEPTSVNPENWIEDLIEKNKNIWIQRLVH